MSTSSTESRGQLILVGGVVIAVLLVTVGIIFNTALYTEAQSVGNTYSGDAAASEDLKDSFRIDITQIIETENKQMDGEATGDTEQIIANINTYSQNRQARYGVVTSLDHASTTSGTRVEWTDSSEQFTNPDGNATWEVTAGFDNIRSYTITPETEALAGLSNPSTSDLSNSSFGVTFNPGTSDNETRYLYRDSNTDKVVIKAVDSSDKVTATCTIDNSSSLAIHLTTNTLTTPFETKQCRQLWPNMDVDTIDYTNGDQVRGRFDFTVDNDGAVITTHSNIETADAVYAMDIDYRYQTSNVKHATTTRVVPNES